MSAAELVEIEAARRMVLEHARVLPVEPLTLAGALARVLAADVSATGAVPAFASSAMDGFAVRSADLAGAAEGRPARLRVVGESRAGHGAGPPLDAGEAAAISTGAELPIGADAVVRVEDARREGEHVEVLSPAAVGRDIRPAGEDLRPGDVAVRAGTRLGPAELGVLASLGCGEVGCVRRPRLSVLVSGDELLGPGEPMRAGGVRDTSSVSIPALALCAGAEVARVRRVRDDAGDTRGALADALGGADVVVACGGVSVGEHDHVRHALRELGAQQVFWGLALKPGKPTWFGTIGTTPVFGLPGNPVSAMVTFTLLVRPLLEALLGAAKPRGVRFAALDADYEKPRGRAHALRCSLSAGERGWIARPARAQGSHILTSMLGADALAIIPSSAAIVRAGERVEIEPLQGGSGALP